MPLPAAPKAGIPRSSGVVQVRLGLGSGPAELPEPPGMNSVAPASESLSTVSIAIDPIQTKAGEPLAQSSAPRQLANPRQQAPNAPMAQGPVKFSLGDDGVVDLGMQRSLTPPTLVQRAPELVRPKKYSVSQVVTVAADADLTSEPSLSPVPRAIQPVSAQPVPSQRVAGQSAAGLPVAAQAVEMASSEYVPAPLPPAPETVPPAAPPAIPKVAESRPMPAPSAAPAAGPVPTPSQNAPAQPARTVNVENTYDIEVLGTYSIDPSIPVASVVALDPDTCNVFHNGRMITVVGNKVGSTVIEIRGVDQSVRTIGLKVLPTGRLHASAPTELDKVKGMIAQHFPTAKLSFIQQPDGGIQVKGTATSEGDARRILELIRKLCLVPIQDQIKVSY